MVGPEVWAGVECSQLRVHGRVVDQLAMTGHAHRAGDMDLLAGLGVSAVRYPILWERIASDGLDTADWGWADARLAKLRRDGVRVIAGLLHHGGGPAGMSLLDPRLPSAFAQFADAVARRYPWIDAFVPVNEPVTTARFSGLYGVWEPHLRSDRAFAELLLAQCVAIRAAADAIRQSNPDATIVVNDDVGTTHSTPALAAEAAFLNERRFLGWDLLFGRVGDDHPSQRTLVVSDAAEAILASLRDDPSPPDLLGIDHYVTSDRFLDHRRERYPVSHWPLDESVPYVDVEAVRVAGLPAAGVRGAISEVWRRYGRPLALTEVSLAGPSADQVAWWHEHWASAMEATELGVDVRAVTAWGAFGAVDWHVLMTEPQGVYEPGCFDARSSPPLTTPLGAAVQATARSLSVPWSPQPAEGAGWWRSSDRYLWQLD